MYLGSLSPFSLWRSAVISLLIPKFPSEFGSRPSPRAVEGDPVGDLWLSLWGLGSHALMPPFGRVFFVRLCLASLGTREQIAGNGPVSCELCEHTALTTVNCQLGSGCDGRLLWCFKTSHTNTKCASLKVLRRLAIGSTSVKAVKQHRCCFYDGTNICHLYLVHACCTQDILSSCGPFESFVSNFGFHADMVAMAARSQASYRNVDTTDRSQSKFLTTYHITSRGAVTRAVFIRPIWGNVYRYYREADGVDRSVVTTEVEFKSEFGSEIRVA